MDNFDKQTHNKYENFKIRKLHTKNYFREKIPNSEHSSVSVLKKLDKKSLISELAIDAKIERIRKQNRKLIEDHETNIIEKFKYQ